MRSVNQNPHISTNDLGLQNAIREQATQINLVSQGRLAAVHALPSAPSGGLHAQGDIVRNSEPVELGSAGSRYVVFGWLCVVGGEPGTFVPLRIATGN